jgi:hypothetical protein
MDGWLGRIQRWIAQGNLIALFSGERGLDEVGEIPELKPPEPDDGHADDRRASSSREDKPVTPRGEASEVR